MTVEQAYIGFVGAGNMAQSLIGGLLAQGYPKQNIGVSDPSPESLAIAKSLGVAAHGNNRQLAERRLAHADQHARFAQHLGTLQKHHSLRLEVELHLHVTRVKAV